MGESIFHLHTWADRIDQRFVAVTTLDAWIQRGELRSFNLTVSGSPGSEIQVECPGATVTEMNSSGERREWTVDLPAGISGRYHATVTARSKSDAAGPWLHGWNVFRPTVRAKGGISLVAKSGAKAAAAPCSPPL